MPPMPRQPRKIQRLISNAANPNLNKLRRNERNQRQDSGGFQSSIGFKLLPVALYGEPCQAFQLRCAKLGRCQRVQRFRH